jgi:hypothetical protein
MRSSWLVLLFAFALTFASVTLLAALMTVVPRLGRAGRRAGDAWSRAPGLDVIVSLFTWIPWVVAAATGGWVGLLGAVAGQMVAMGAWCLWHELAHPRARQGPRIVKFINRTVGRWQNHLALWLTAIALPGFLFIRFLEYVMYPPLVWLLDFPRYRQDEWVNVTRQKFDGLVGHDLIWCLYCDWMTGVYSLGAEMLRNVESFWCPIRFYDGKKCENCRVDFPDITGGWVAPDKTMADVEQVMEEQYGTGQRAWFGSPVRVTVRGEPIAIPAAGTTEEQPVAPR